jgi:hypothetical protein
MVTLREQISQFIAGKPIVTQDALAKALKQYAEEQRRSQILQANQYQNKIVETPWNYQILKEWVKNNEVLRTVVESIIKEAMRNKWTVQPKWTRKCPVCGSEFQSEVERCPDCSHSNGVKVATLKPQVEQRQRLKAFLDQPNPDDEMSDIIGSAFRDMLSTDDWYISMQQAANGSPFTIYNEDSSFMRVCADKYGRLGNKELFCVEDREFPERTVPKGKTCPDHPDAELKETAYLYIEDSIKGRFSRDEILHSKAHPWRPSLYGVSLAISCLRTLMTIAAMDQFNFDNYSEGKLGNILCFEGLSPEEATNLAQEVEKQKNMPKLDVNTGRYVIKKLRTLFLGTGGKGGTTNVPAMPESEKMQSLEWFKLWKQIVCSIYGVQDVYAGGSEAGSTGQNPRMKVDVNNNTVEFWQQQFEEPFNNVVVAALGVTDWVFKFNPLEEKDEMQDITILQGKLTAIQTAISLGMNAELTDEGEVKLSGTPLSLQEKQQMAMEQMQKQAELQPKQDEGDGKDKQGNPAFEGKKPFKKEEVFPAEKASEEWIVKKVIKK